MSLSSVYDIIGGMTYSHGNDDADDECDIRAM